MVTLLLAAALAAPVPEGVLRYDPADGYLVFEGGRWGRAADQPPLQGVAGAWGPARSWYPFAARRRRARLMAPTASGKIGYYSGDGRTTAGPAPCRCRRRPGSPPGCRRAPCGRGRS